MIYRIDQEKPRLIQQIINQARFEMSAKQVRLIKLYEIFSQDFD